MNNVLTLLVVFGLATSANLASVGQKRAVGPAGAILEVENRTLDEIYAAALAEGGKLVIYAGGDIITSQDGRKALFEARFPNMTMDVIVDLSKFHDGRIDNQLARNDLKCDLTQLQTVQDFPRWRDAGVLLPYKPLGWEHIYPSVKDEDGAFTGIHFTAFGIIINTRLLPNEADWPKVATALLKPEFANWLVGTYPNDDDATLFWYKLMVDKYGWEYMSQLAAQNITFVRGTQTSNDAITAGKYPASMGTWASLVPNPNTDALQLLETDPFMSWPQTAAIFKDAKHPESAKLYMSWVMSPEVQAGRFSIRDDVPSPTNKTIWEYTNTNPLDFFDFMADRESVELFKTQITLYFGEVTGGSPTLNPGIDPIEAIPH